VDSRHDDRRVSQPHAEALHHQLGGSDVLKAVKV